MNRATLGEKNDGCDYELSKHVIWHKIALSAFGWKRSGLQTQLKL
jgi:hypothetical protein